MATKQQIDKLRNKLLKWDDAYHNGEELVSDEEYERHRDLLRKWAPKDKYFNRVGATTNASNKVRLPYPMPSLGKVYPDRGAPDWLKNSSGNIAVLDKLDGSSAMLDTDPDGTMFYSRGNGTVGQNISRMLEHVQGIPKKLPRVLRVRGELLISTVDYRKYSDDYDNPRALANSQVTTTKSFKKAVKDVVFVAHEQIKPSLDWKRARINLKSLGFNTVPTKIFKNPTVAMLVDYLKERRQKSLYELDGLVLIDLDTGKRISFKVNQPPVRVIVDHVEWNISQNSIWKPRVILKTPIRIGGVMVTKATAHNARYVFDNGIGPGAEIMLVRAGDVIPKVVGVVKKTKPQMPDDYKWDSNKVEALATKLSDDHEALVSAKRLVNAFSVIGIAGVKIGTAEKLVDNGLDYIGAFYDTVGEDLYQQIEDSGIGGVNSKKLFQAVVASRRTVSHAVFMDASGIWPKGYTVTRFTVILERWTFKELIAAYKANKVKLRNEIAELKGMSRTSATEFVKGFAPYVKFLKNIKFIPKKDHDKVSVVAGKLSGKEYVFTGVRNSAAEEFIRKNGGIVATRVSKTTTNVIAKDQEANSDKITKAAGLGIPVSSLDTFLKQHKL